MKIKKDMAKNLDIFRKKIMIVVAFMSKRKLCILV